jgi:hypothetical protein
MIYINKLFLKTGDESRIPVNQIERADYVELVNADGTAAVLKDRFGFHGKFAGTLPATTLNPIEFRRLFDRNVG